MWWAVKYDDIYMHNYQTIPECKSGLERYLGFYNTERRCRQFMFLAVFFTTVCMSFLKSVSVDFL